MAALLCTVFDLPPEIKLEILLMVLHNTDISTAKQPVHAFLQGGYDTDDLYSILDPYDLRNLWYYLKIFRPSRNIIWEAHVRFVFPTTLSMLDVFSQWPSKRLQQVRRVKFFGQSFRTRRSNSTDYGTLFFYPSSALNALPNLKLDHLEYEPEDLLEQERNMRCRTLAEREIHRMLFLTQGWKRLSVLAPQPNLTELEVNQLVLDLRSVSQIFPQNHYVLDLPNTPVMRDKKTGIVVGLRKGPGICEATHFVPGLTRASWLSERDVDEQIVLEKDNWAACTPERSFYPKMRDRNLRMILQEDDWKSVRQQMWMVEIGSGW